MFSKEYVERNSTPEPNTGCWLWIGAYLKSGYGRVGRRSRRAHRVSYAAFIGQIPDGQVVCHRCDTPACVNPAHLFLGTQEDNLRDMFAKGRNRIGRGCRPGAKLTPQQVLDVRAAVGAGELHRTVAARFGITRPHVSKLVRGVRGAI